MLKVGVFPYHQLITECALSLEKLEPNNRQCRDVGLGAEILGTALNVARIPHFVVPLKFDGNTGSYDENEQKFTGTGLLCANYCIYGNVCKVLKRPISPPRISPLPKMALRFV